MMANLKTGTTVAGQTAWHAGNDGAGSGLDADTVDALQASAFVPGQNAASLPAPRFAGDIGIDSDSWPREWDNAWHYPLLINGWVRYNAEGADRWGPARYRTTMNGLIVMEGLVRGGSGTILVIPSPYRPPTHQMLTTISGGNYGSRLSVGSDGTVNYIPFANGTNEYVSLCCWWYGGY